jgi:hypothetical protein
VTHAPYPNNVIPASQLDKVAMRISDYVKPANMANQGWQGIVPNLLASNDLNTKFHYLASDKHQVTAGYFFTRGSQTQSGGGNMGWSVQTHSWQQQNFNAGDTWTISPTAKCERTPGVCRASAFMACGKSAEIGLGAAD